jgi:hypothetical protein
MSLRVVWSLAAALALTVLAALTACAPVPGAGDRPVSEELLESAVRLRGLALADMEDGRYDDAAERLRALAEILPDNLLPPINLAICYLRLDRRADAWREIERARTLAPDNPQMLYTLARLLDEEPEAEARRRELVAAFKQMHPHDVRPHYLEAEGHLRARRYGQAAAALERALAEEPENIVLLADLLVAGAESGDPEILIDALNAIEDRLDGFESSLAEYAADLRRQAAGGDLEGARPAAVVVRNLLRPGELYQVHLAPLVGGRGAGGDLFPQLDFVPALPKRVQGGLDIEIALRDATAELPDGIASGRPLAVVASPPGTEMVLAETGGTLGLWRRAEVVPLPAEAAADDFVLLHPFDGDELPDLVRATPEGLVTISAGRADGGFSPPRQVYSAAPGSSSSALAPLDIDHDGDLDLLLGRRAAPDLYLQNNGDGSWSERSGELGIAGPAADTTDVLVVDVDNDGDLDLLTLHGEERPRLYSNQRRGRLREEGEAWGLSGSAAARGAALDVDGDGLFDLLLWGGGSPRLFGNRGSAFSADPLPEALAAPWSAALPADLDNDGDQDVLVAPVGERTALLARNRGGELVAEPATIELEGALELLAADLDDDGDLDVVAATEGGASRWFRNDGGNRNHWLRLALRGRYDNNSKNNLEGLFTRIEARSGDTFQVTLGNGGVNHLGLGDRRQADVVRVVWTNGIAQLWQLVSADRTLVEEQMLKGSCPFLYTWNGREFEFVTDLMWKSPLGMVLADGSPAPHQSSRDFVLIPGELLRPAGGELWLQVTEELWESVYVDRQELTAVDHPAAVELVVDEKFTPPPHPDKAPIHWLDERRTPVAARDQTGRDVLDLVAHRDERYVDRLPLTRYQGVTEGQSLELAFDEVPADERLRLVLWGWIFPTDTSINTAIAQGSQLPPTGPMLERRTADGGWRIVDDFIGFPAGKRKAVVVELTDRVPGGRVELRLRTSLQIYWDAALLAVGDPRPAAVATRLEPRVADLHARGYSRQRPRSDSAPHLFDYSRVSTGPRFRDMSGLFTRYGPVTELLAAEDDMYAVMNAGDELTVRYDASALPPLPAGWRRDWILYTDGWVKDADVNTAGSQTVGPLPFHAQRAYPDPTLGYPDDAEHRRFLELFQTRRVDDKPFRNALRSDR